MEELEGRKGEEFELCVYQFVVLLYWKLLGWKNENVVLVHY
jgi:hypothetical protein